MYKIENSRPDKLIQILDKLKVSYKIIGNAKVGYFSNISSVFYADELSLVFVGIDTADQINLITNSPARVIICSCELTLNKIEGKIFILVDNPKLVYAKVVNHILKTEQLFGIDPSTTLNKDARIHKNCYIGPNTYIGKASIDEGTVISGNCYIFDNVSIGKRVVIDPGCVIGSQGFGFVRDADGKAVRFPQIGGVIIEDDVEIGANTCIDRGALNNTIIHEGVKIDNLVHIAHNVVIGKHSYIISNSIISGSTIIGEYCWISPSSAVNNKLKIGDRSTIGIGSVVIKNVPDGATYMGNPAVPVNTYITNQKKMKNL